MAGVSEHGWEQVSMAGASPATTIHEYSLPKSRVVARLPCHEYDEKI